MIDAACSYAGYASDITRTYNYQDDAFADLIRQFDALQQGLIARIMPSMTQGQLHEFCRQAIAAFMKANHLITCSEEEACDKDIVGSFFPHGLGYMLGFQVHDMVLFAANTGLRPDEIYRLEHRDVDIEYDEATEETILVIEVCGKRGVGFCKSTANAVRPYERIVERNEPDLQDKLFPHNHLRMFNKVLTQEGLKEIVTDRNVPFIACDIPTLQESWLTF